MHLVLCAERRLSSLYGAAYPALAAALQAALDARSAAGIAGLRYDPEAGIPEWQVPAAPLEPDALVAQLQAIEALLAARGAIIESLWIIGGPAVVPFGVLPNPMPDSDRGVVGDSCYGLADLGAPLPRWPVGRTPDREPLADDLLPRLLQHVAAAHQAGAQAPGAVSALTAAVWADVADSLFGTLPEPVATQVSPAAQGAPNLDVLFAARRIVCNLHGLRRNADWLGQAQMGGPFIPALQVADPAGYDLRGKLLISQACYGARLSLVDGRESLATALLDAGLSALIAPPGLAYGAIDPPPAASDVLVAAVLAELARPGVRVGAALLAAQQTLLRTALLRGGPDADELKTLLGFVLYADPALQWS